MPEDVARLHKRYSLWAYSEGHHIDAMRKMKFSGIPVLFLPGSGGSHKQGRHILHKLSLIIQLFLHLLT